MNVSSPPKADSLSDAERGLLRDSVRDFLSKRWPAEHAVERSSSAEAIAALWRELAGQGLASLGADAAEAGLREIVLVFEELGRASCPAPLLGAVAANLALAGQQSNTVHAMLEDLHQGNAMIAVALGAFDGDPAAGRADIRGDTLSGKAAFVEGAQTATHFLVFTEHAGRRGAGGRWRARIEDASHARPRRAAVLRTYVREHAGRAIGYSFRDAWRTSRWSRGSLAPAGRLARPSAHSSLPSIMPRYESNSAS